MTREDMIKISEAATVEKLLECYGMHAVMMADQDYDPELKARAEMANEVIKAELISRTTK